MSHHMSNMASDMNTGLKFSTKVNGILFGDWSTSSFWEYAFVLVIILISSFLLEYLQYLKPRVQKLYLYHSSNSSNNSQWVIWKYKIALMLLHITILVFHFIIMLIVMTFNLGFILTILVGAGIGFLLCLEPPKSNDEYIPMKDQSTPITPPSMADHCNS
ncbi:hypothetical protein DLAC_11540 [Tieghemostelium lacteum]|uniref:Copper transport protein n=1 Tax=Tieghemostelium lacteum TaxID=361077 RepID=A0A152A265_TIELA|nr:hypothetical protein DLAC_11540 [Tieghemostelium lacteum]|eukprot:KYR00343.1 hypothetical protein DLAC_11540 [Tieghemostelium lacteum]